VHLFAEPVVARLEIVVDRDRLDPRRVEARTAFRPYDVIGTSRERDDRGRFTVLRHEYTLRCLRLACIPEVLASAAGEAESGRGERRTFVLPAVRVVYAEPGGKERLLRSAPWPPLVSVSRIKESDVPRFGYVFKTSVAPLPDPDYRISPAWLGIGLLAGAAALLALPLALVVRWWRRRQPPPVVTEPELSPLERALRLVERAGGAERRQALELLACRLERRPPLAGAARALAWSPLPPSPADSAALVRAVRGDDAAQ